MLKIAICDDCEADRGRVHGYVKEYIEARHLAAEIYVYDHPDTLLSECEKLRPQLYILDIVMPMVTGIEAARELRWNQKDAQIIFATAEPSYALESFDVNPINYILKPVDKEKLFDTMDLAITHIDISEEKSIVIKNKQGLFTIFLRDIMYIEYRNHVVSYHIMNGETISTSTMRIGFSEYLKTTHAESGIIQCHESFAVSIAAIDMLGRMDITVRTGDLVPVSKSRYEEVSKAYLNYRFS